MKGATKETTWIDEVNKIMDEPELLLKCDDVEINLVLNSVFNTFSKIMITSSGRLRKHTIEMISYLKKRKK